MPLRAASQCILVTPTGDQDQTEQGRIIVVHNESADKRIYRGVVGDVGKLVQADIKPGDVALYLDFYLLPSEGRLGEKHVVHESNLLAYEDSE